MIIQIVGRGTSNFYPFDVAAHSLDVFDKGKWNLFNIRAKENEDFITNFFKFFKLDLFKVSKSKKT